MLLYKKDMHLKFYHLIKFVRHAGNLPRCIVELHGNLKD